MAIFLVQHGKSLPKNIDPEKGLSPEGLAEVKQMAGMVADQHLKVSSIRHSGKKRALQTAEFFAQALKPTNGLEEMGGMGPLDDVISVADSLEGEDNIMLVGHLPFLERLASFLVTGNIDKPIIKFQNAGVVCLSQDSESKGWAINWALVPHLK